MPEHQTSFPSRPGAKAPKATGAVASSSPGSSPTWKPGALAVTATCVLLFVAVTWTFLPSLRNGFLGYDDNLLVTANPQVQSGLTWQNLIWAFRTPVVYTWHPLTLISHMLDCQLYGLKPWGHHLTSVLIHALNTVLLFLVFRRMTGAFWRCAVLAALFGLHPLRVESVAWVAERKDVLSACFFLLTLWSYAAYVSRLDDRKSESGIHPVSSIQTPLPRSPATRFYAFTLTLFALGLMCKPMLITVPFVLLLLDYWPLRRLKVENQKSTINNLVWEKLPFLGLAAASAAVTFLVQQQAGMLSTMPTIGNRLANALVSYARYLGKLCWPLNLSVFYPYPSHWPPWQVAASAGLVLAVLVAVVRLARNRPYLVFGWLWFCGMLVPVIGLVQAGEQSMADRYSYLPSIGLFAMLVWGIQELSSRWRAGRVALAVVTLVPLLLCIIITRRQIGYWQNNETLFSHALDVTENNDLAHFNLGSELLARGAIAEAIPHYEAAVRIHPDKADAHSSLANALALSHKFAEAIQEYEVALRLKPDDAETHDNFADVLLQAGQLDRAITHYTEAARLEPRNPKIHYDLGSALAQKGDLAPAAQQFELSLEIEPGSAPAHYALGTIYRLQGKAPAAMSQWQAAARLAPRWPEPLNNLAWVLATDTNPELRNGPEAVRLATRAVGLSGTNNLTLLDTLAAAYAEANQFSEATATARAAHAKAIDQGQSNLAGQIQQRLALYESRQPYRDAANPK